jgi:hypothetical protein
MSVMMGLRVDVDPARFEQVVNADPARLGRIAQRAKEKGAIHHSFYANADGGEILVVDEWPDAASFYAFFEDATDIEQLMADAGVQNRPAPSFWRLLDTPDRF